MDEMDAETRIMYDRLKQIAREGRISYYSHEGPLIGLDMDSPADRQRISEVLDEISLAEHHEGNPLLSAVIVLLEKNIPGDGFFVFAQNLGQFDGGDRLLYWIEELRRVHDHWLSQN